MKCNDINVQLLGSDENEVLSFAKDELNLFLRNCQSFNNSDKNWIFILGVKPEMDAYSFSVQYNLNKNEINLSGADSTCVLHAVYTMLEDIGYCFEITGPVSSKKLSIDGFVPNSKTINPKVKERGIRQHINFPMDISSYTLDDAKEYIRNLARMRFNHITFHSYPNQWIPIAEREEFAGHFFYGVRHDIPSKEVIIENIENETTFCIPEIESSYDNSQLRSDLAVEWLREVMLEAKRVGMQVQLSFEPRSTSTDIAPTLQTVESILESYPMIDVLEVMTQEFNRDYAIVPASDIVSIENEHFGKNVLSDDVFAVNGVKLLVGEVCHNIKVIDALQAKVCDDNTNYPKIALGVYCVMPEYFDVSLSLVQEYLNEQTRFAFLAGHSSPLTLDNMKSIDMNHNLKTDIWSRTMVYNWIEFDGLMYLQQNSIKGVYEMIKWLPVQDNGQLCSGLSFNHWRTAENRTVARYASLACIFGSIEPNEFYKEYANILGIVDVDAYIKAMTYLDNITIKTTTNAINIGFCFVGCWLRNGLGWIEDLWKLGPVAEVRKGYDYVALLLKKCSITSMEKEAANYLSFIDNRVRCTIIHLKAMEKALELPAICAGKKAGELDDCQKDKVLEVCEHALAITDQYMKVHTEQMLDRGCEGTLISYYHTLPAVLKRIRFEYCGVPYEQSAAQDYQIDAPPEPMMFG